LSSNTANINANTASITTNTSSIVTNTTAITANTSAVNTNTTAIAAEATTARAAELALTNNINSNTTNTTSNTSAIAANTASILTNSSDIELRAPIISPTFTGTPTGPTAAAGISTTQLATTAFVNNATLNINASSISGTVAVSKGGTGATTLTGLIKGTGTSAFTVATAGTDYLLPTGSAASLTSFPTFNQNTTGNATTATIAGNITATSNSTLSSLSSLNTVGTITSGSISLTTNIKTSGTLTAGTVTYPNTHNSTAGQLLSINATGTAAWSTPASGGGTHAIGDLYGGGIVFYVWEDGAHGLIAATADFTGKYFGADGTLVSSSIYPLRDGIGAGRNNTERIIQNIKTTDNIFKTDYTLYAALACLTYQGGNYGDWYLPSKYESNLLYLQKTLLGMSGMYWTSNDYAARDAYYQNFSTGLFVGQTKNYASYNVRPIRSF
jgi:hypothetical protein